MIDLDSEYEDGEPKGCNIGCLAMLALTLLVDAVIVIAIIEVVKLIFNCF